MSQQNPQQGNNDKTKQNPQHQQGTQNPNKTGQHEQADRKDGQQGRGQPQGQPGSKTGGRD